MQRNPENRGRVQHATPILGIHLLFCVIPTVDDLYQFITLDEMLLVC
jgi:hypothetical protein